MSTIRWTSGALAVAVLALVAGGPASAEPTSKRSPQQRWVPSVTGTFRFFDYEADGRIQSSIGFSNSGSTSTTIPVVQLGGDLLSPSLEALPAAPHVVGFGGIQLGPKQSIDPAGAGALVSGEPETEVADLEANPPVSFPPGDEIEGQGSSLTGSYRSIGWYLGMGLVFDLPRDEPRVRVRPYVTYVGEIARAKGKAVRVTGQPPGQPYVIERASASQTEAYHYLGPGLELELIVATEEAWAVSLFASGDFLFSVGDRSTTFASGTGFASFRYTADDFQPRAGLGVRVSWLTAL